MKNDTRIGVSVVLVGLSLFALGVGSVDAEPSAACRDLAAQFGSAPAQLDARSLAALMLCVSSEVGDRLGAPRIAPASSPGVEPSSAPPPEQQSTPAPRKMYGDWPQPSPWGESWPKSSWDQ
jgi:hypothetical protein